MKTQRERSRSSLVALGGSVAGILIVGFLVANALNKTAAPSPSSTTATSSTNSTSPTFAIPIESTSTTDKALGLRMDLNLSANSNGTITISVDEYNTQDQENNVSAGSDLPNASLDLWRTTGCGLSDPPVGYAVFAGNYRLNNYSSTNALWLQYRTDVPTCVSFLSPPYYTFYPRSDKLVGNPFYGLLSANVTGAWSGFWTGTRAEGQLNVYAGDCQGVTPPDTPENCPLTLTPFPPGTYTVLAADEWGQTIILHFNVDGPSAKV